MSKGAGAVKNVHRWILGAASGVEAELVGMEEHVWLNRQTRCRKHHLRGVPAAWLTVLIDDRWWTPDDRPLDYWCVELVDKLGRYDGFARPQIALRLLPSHTCRDYVVADLVVDRQEKMTRVAIDTGCEEPDSGLLGISPEIRWSMNFQRLEESLDNYDLARIFWWHWTRYYRVPVPRRDAEERVADWLADITMQMASEPMGLAEANRHVSRWLYRLARQLGWRKLTKREQDKLGLSGPWHREEECPLRDDPQGRWSKSGCGRYTIESARSEK